jgi:hypothetical protein
MKTIQSGESKTVRKLIKFLPIFLIIFYLFTNCQAQLLPKITIGF